MATFWETAAHLVGHLFSLSFVYLLYLFISRFGLKSGICLLIASVPVHFWSITIKYQRPTFRAKIRKMTTYYLKIIEKLSIFTNYSILYRHVLLVIVYLILVKQSRYGLSQILLSSTSTGI